MATLLQVINHMLYTLGENGTSDEDSLHPSVLKVTGVLENVDIEFQSRGWWFNKDFDIALVKDADGIVTVPSAALCVNISAERLQRMTPYERKRYTVRGLRVYDTYEHTYAVDTTIYVDTVTRLAIPLLPEVAATYLKHAAAERIYTDDDGDRDKLSKLQERTTRAWAQLMAEELKHTAANAFDSPAAQQLRYRMGPMGARNPNLIGGLYR